MRGLKLFISVQNANKPCIIKEIHIFIKGVLLDAHSNFPQIKPTNENHIIRWFHRFANKWTTKPIHSLERDLCLVFSFL